MIPVNSFVLFLTFIVTLLVFIYLICLKKQKDFLLTEEQYQALNTIKGTIKVYENVNLNSSSYEEYKVIAKIKEKSILFLLQEEERELLEVSYINISCHYRDLSNPYRIYDGIKFCTREGKLFVFTENQIVLNPQEYIGFIYNGMPLWIIRLTTLIEKQKENHRKYGKYFSWKEYF